MTLTATAPRRSRIGELLLSRGFIDQAKLQAGLVEQKRWGGRLGRTLLDMGFIDDVSLARALSEQLALPLVDLDGIVFQQNIVELLKPELAERYNVFPIGRDVRSRTLKLACSDPNNYEAQQELMMLTGYKLGISVSSSGGIARAIRRYYYGDTASVAPAQVPTEAHLETVEGSDTSEVEVLRQQNARLEQTLAAQGRVLRTLAEMLFEHGFLNREEFNLRLRKLAAVSDKPA